VRRLAVIAIYRGVALGVIALILGTVGADTANDAVDEVDQELEEFENP
jgi:hypothetical protein